MIWLLLPAFALVQVGLFVAAFLLLKRFRAPAPVPAIIQGYTATLKNYGGSEESSWNGTGVRVGRYLDKFGYFEVFPLDGKNGDYSIFAKAEELVPADQRTTEFIVARALPKLADPVYYGDEVYDLRDLLDEVGVHVTAASVAEWTPLERANVKAWAVALKATPDNPPKLPKELR